MRPIRRGDGESTLALLGAGIAVPLAYTVSRSSPRRFFAGFSVVGTTASELVLRSV